MKRLKSFLTLLVLSLTPIQLWGGQTEDLEGTILGLYQSRVEIYENFFRNDSLNFTKGSFHSLFQKIPNKAIINCLQLQYSNSEKLFKSILAIKNLSEFETTFKNALITDTIKSDQKIALELRLESWSGLVKNMRESIFRDNRILREFKFKLLVLDAFSPYFWLSNKLNFSLNESESNVKQYTLKIAYFWLLDEMIQFFMEKDFMETEQSLHILKCINILLQESKFSPIANKEQVYEFYCEIWLEQTDLNTESKTFGSLERIFNQSESESYWKNIYLKAADMKLKNLELGTFATLAALHHLKSKAEKEALERHRELLRVGCSVM